MVMGIKMNFTKYRKIYFTLSGILILASIVLFILWGLKPGIDFTGGSVLEIEYKGERPSIQTIREKLTEFDFKELYLQPIGQNGIILRLKEKNLSPETTQEVIEKLKEAGQLEENTAGFESISPIIGRELKRKTKIAIVLALISIVLYIAWAFRKVSRPAKSWQYGIASLLALGHDILIPLGVFSFLGEFYGVQITIPIIAALLTILGYSVNNTVVVFDRIRENLLKSRGSNYEETVNISLKQTLTRSINTSLTTLFVLFAIFFFGGETLKYFSLALILGIGFGTYSSILLASSFLVIWQKWRMKKI